MCLLGVALIMLPIYGVKSPKNPFWDVNRHYQAKRNCCVDSNQIVCNDKHHQMLSVGGTNAYTTDPRWRTAAILKKSKNRHISVTVLPIVAIFHMIMHIDRVHAIGR